MMNKRLWAIPAAMLLSGALYQAAAVAEDEATAAAEPAAGAAEIVTFESLDVDTNGAISGDEAQANPALRAVWEEIDTNRDGQLDEAEFSAVEITGGPQGGTE